MNSNENLLLDKPKTADNANVIKKKKRPALAIVLILFVLITIGVVYLMAISSPETSTKIKDIFIVVYALESVVIAVAFVVLIMQAAKLINMTKSEVKPILKTTQDTVNNVKGTVVFLGNNLVEPTIKANSTAAGVTKVLTSVLSIFKK